MSLSCYFQNYFTHYFDVCVPRPDGDWGPTPQQWKRYLKKLNESQKERMAQKVADRQNLREMILAKLVPGTRRIVVRKEETKTEPVREEPRYEVRQIRLPQIPDAQAEIRRRLAQEIRDIRRRAKRIREKRRREAILRRLREEEALVLLL